MADNIDSSNPQRLTTFSVKDLSSSERTLYNSLVNQSFFYRGHPAGLVVGVATYFGMRIRSPLPSYPALLLTCFATSITASMVARDSYMETVQRRVVNELPPSSYLRQSVEQGLVFRSTFFKNLTMPINETNFGKKDV